VLLALSRGGGRAGERSQPLLVSEADWDALGERLHSVIPELADPDLIRLLAALEYGLREDPSDGELKAAATTALRAIAASWKRGEAFASPTVLERWNRAAELLPISDAPFMRVGIWSPPPSTPFETPQRAHAALPAAPPWDDREAESVIVARILSDLPAA
jgi:hypothetical protein